jgi:hypothetical protein
MQPETPETPPQVGIEIREGRPWWKICCVGCFAILIAIVVLVWFAWRGATGGGPRSLATLPANFPPSVDVYRLEDAKSIIYLPGGEKDRLVALVLAPFKFFGNVMVSDRGTGDDASQKQWVDRITDGKVSQLQKVDTVTIAWERLKADRDETEQWYLSGFQRNGFAVLSRRDAATATDVVIAQRDDARVQLQIQDLADIAGIDSIIMIVDYMNQ